MTVTGAPSRRGIAALPYTAYAWTTFTVCVLPAILGAALLPGLERRRRWVSACARGFFRLAGIGVSVRGTARLPDGHAVVVANHASYLDGVILQAFLPPRFSYVIKREMHSVPLGGLLLRRIGSRFVDRNRATASARDARSLVRAAANGEALAFFPEGTFRREAGLGRFRGGAFVTAVKAAAPVVPVVIRGSREILPSGTMLVRRSKLEIDVLEPVAPEHAEFDKPQRLAEIVRMRMLEALDEPDLLAAD